MCPEFTEHISALVDGELDQASTEQLRAHAETCKDCRRRMRVYRSLKHAIARLNACQQSPEAVGARIQTLLLQSRFSSYRSRRAVIAGSVGLATAATIAAILLAYQTDGTDHVDRGDLASELIADHMRYVPESMPAEIASGDSVAVVAFFADKLSFDPVVPRFPTAQLAGGRVCTIDGSKVELLFYHFGDTTLSLYVKKHSPEGTGDCHSAQGHNVCTHTIGALDIMLVGALGADELRRMLANAQI